MATIDVEDENILTAIFKDSFPDNWKDTPDFVQYLSELSSYGVEKLSLEPDRLADEKCQILEETQNLAFQNYKTFIQTAECSREIFEDFQIIEKHVDGMLHKLPEFYKECDSVMKKAQDVNASRKMNILTLQRHTQLLEILEMPQLMDTCVRNGYYEEALELASHVKRLEKKHSQIPVIATIVNEVKNSTQLMLNQLIQQLRTNVQLPACLRVIGYLRRMDVFTEAELRIKFLQARDSWFQGILDALSKEDAYIHITKTIEASRVHLFDIMTQYRAIFSDEDPLLSTNKDDSINESALFYGWVVQRITKFLQTLESDLHQGVGGRLDSILGQCMYFGLSFSRVGADFRGLLAPIFQQAALNGFTTCLQQANLRFEENMQSYNLLSSTSTVSGLSYSSSSQSGQLTPPTVLLDYYPLAVYLNEVLNAFNELRLCAPISLASQVAEAVKNSLENINRVILAFHRAEETTFDQKEHEKFEHFCSVYAKDLVPYLNKCLQVLFPPSQIAQVLGVSVSELTKMGNLGVIDEVAVLCSVNHLIPKREEETVGSESSTKSGVDQLDIASATNSNQSDSATSEMKQIDNVNQSASVKIDQSDSSKTDQSGVGNLGHSTEGQGDQSCAENQDHTTEGQGHDLDSEKERPKVVFTTGDYDSEEEHHLQAESDKTENISTVSEEPKVDIDLSKDIVAGLLEGQKSDSEKNQSDDIEDKKQD